MTTEAPALEHRYMPACCCVAVSSKVKTFHLSGNLFKTQEGYMRKTTTTACLKGGKTFHPVGNLGEDRK